MTQPQSPTSHINAQVRFSDVFADILIELVVTTAPIAGLAYALTLNGQVEELLFHEEWIFVSAILFAQSIVKLMQALSFRKQRHRWVILVAVLIGVFGVLPCSILLAHRTFLKPDFTHPGHLREINLILFVSSGIIFSWAVGVAAYATERKKQLITP